MIGVSVDVIDEFQWNGEIWRTYCGDIIASEDGSTNTYRSQPEIKNHEALSLISLLQSL